MPRHPGKAATAAAVLLLWAGGSMAVELGQPLAQALEELRRAGLQLIFSSALVEPSLEVTVDPGAGTPEEQARRILAPHGLTLQTIRPRVFAVIAATDVTPPVEASARAPGARTPAGEGALESSGPLFEIDIYASRYQIDRQQPGALAELTREDLDALPGLDQDVLRVARYLPGTASSPVSARSHVRGGYQDEVAVLFDGVPLFEPFHYKDIQGVLGILDPGTISSIDFFSGVFPVRHGNRLSGVLDIRPRRWTGHNEHAIGASLLYTHVLSQGRLESRPVEWLAAVRRGNIDLIGDVLERHEAEPQFIDALGRVQIDVGDRSSLVAGWLLLDDGLEANLSGGSEQGDIDYRDGTGWLAWRFRPNAASDGRLTLARTERHTDREGQLNRAGSAIGMLDDRRRFDTTTLRLELGGSLNERWQLNGGLEWRDYDAHYDYFSTTELNPTLAAAFGRPSSITRDIELDIGGEASAAFLSNLISLNDRTTVDIGVRWDGQRFGDAFHDDQVSPRLAVQYQYDPQTILRLSWGRLAQTERPDELQVQDGEPVFHPAQRATQTVLSLERRLAHGSLLRIEAFDKRIRELRPAYENLMDPFALLPELEVDRVRVAPDRTRAYGAELSLRWQLPETWSGWASYSWSEVTDRFGAASALRSWDQKHSIATGLAWSRAPWMFSANLSWHSGWRRNELFLVEAGVDPVVELSRRNAATWPDYFSLDLRGTWWRELSRGALEVFAEVNNTTDHENLCCANYQLLDAEGDVPLQRRDSTWLPRFVLVGVTWHLP